MNAIIFGAENNLSVHIDMQKKDLLVLGEDPSQGLDDTTITTETEYFLSFTKSNRKLCLSVHYNGSYSFCFLMCLCYKNISIQSKRLSNKTVPIVFRKYFKRFCSQ